jgi:endoglucanase
MKRPSQVVRNLSLSLLCASAISGCAGTSPGKSASPRVAEVANLPAKYGKLQVVGRHLCDSAGRPVQLRGMSTMGLQWYGEIVNDKAFAALAGDWKADVVRLALYVGEGGYAAHPGLEKLVFAGVDLAIKYGMYAIVDWHVLTPGDPNDPVYAGAQAFFDEVSRKYAKVPNVLYEIMNEPNGQVSWAGQLKPYAEKMVATIRANDPSNVILIGSGTWSQDVDVAAANPVRGNNLAYTFHFYAGSHGEALRHKVEVALDRGVAVFCSEWGTSEASGTGGPYLSAAEEWLAFLDRHGIGWTNWSLCDKSESSAALKSLAEAMKEGKTAFADRESLLVPATMGPEGYPIWGPDELSASGAFVRGKLRARTAPVRAGARSAQRRDRSSNSRDMRYRNWALVVR